MIKEKCYWKLRATKAGVKQKTAQQHQAALGHDLGKDMKNNAFNWHYKQDLGKQNVIT